MFKLKYLKRILAFVTCSVISVSALTYNVPYTKLFTSAKTTSELAAEKSANSAKIAELQKQLDAYNSSAQQESEYQSVLSEKMSTQQENLEIINEELESLSTEIEEKEKSISEIEDKMELQEADISDGMDAFKERLRAIYIVGNDSLASALVGSTDFYDLLSKYELISRVANYDNNLVNELKDELNEYAKTRKELETEKNELNVQKTEKDERKQEMQEALDELSEDYQNSQEKIESDKLAANSVQSDIDSLNKTNNQLESEIQELQKKLDEENAKAKEESAQQSTTAADNSNQTSKTTTTTTKKQEENNKEETEKQAEAGTTPTTTTTTTIQTQAPQTEAPQTQAPVVEEEPETEAPTTAVSTGGFSWPCPASYTVSSGYGYRWGSLHAGIDIAGGNAGCAVVASKSGTVIKVVSGCSHNYPKSSSCGCGGGYGNYVIISHDGTYTTLYGHMASVSVSVGQSVSAGQTIGTVGSTGYSTGYHLHFEIRQNGASVNPMSYLY
jgi:murein DD-endopeptidase MepM/ murein hydrolase activator NlpD